jgi:flagellar hook protein FlgE
MGIFGALTTAVSGLRAQSYALENISGNIANSQTPGFKRVETSFVDMIPELPYRREVAGSVAAFSRLTNTIKGDPNSTGVATNVAISGEGFFMVQERVGYSNNQPIFGGTDLFTRRGDFQLDKDGYLVNGAGFYLRGTTIDPVTGQVRGNGASDIKISSDPVSSQKTTDILYKANLPTRPATEDASLENPDSVLFQEPGPDAAADGVPDTYVPSSAVTTTRDPALAPIGVRGADEASFQYSTASGLVQASTIEQDGYPSGSLSSVQVMSDGRVVGNYTNGRTVPVAEIPIVQFNADNALKRLDSGAYERTLESGLPIIGLNGSSLIGGYIEGSNTDIAEEFSKMIVTQQAYSANTRVVSTSQQMMSEVINMVR